MSAADDVLRGILGEGKVERRGPQGGNIDNVRQYPKARDAHFNAPLDPATGLPGLHSSYKPTTVCGRIDEPEWARMAAFMLLAGRTNSEIALSARVATATVSQIRGQRWFQELLATLANEMGEEVLGLIQSEAVASVQKIVDLRDSSENEKVILAASVWLAEQSTGKAIQKVQTINLNRNYSSPDEEIADIESQLAALRSARAQKTQPTIDIEGQPSQPT